MLYLLNRLIISRLIQFPIGNLAGISLALTIITFRQWAITSNGQELSTNKLTEKQLEYDRSQLDAANKNTRSLQDQLENDKSHLDAANESTLLLQEQLKNAGSENKGLEEELNLQRKIANEAINSQLKLGGQLTSAILDSPGDECNSGNKAGISDKAEPLFDQGDDDISFHLEEF
jgi:hypothetical protein